MVEHGLRSNLKNMCAYEKVPYMVFSPSFMNGIHTFIHLEGGYGGKPSPIINLSAISAGHLRSFNFPPIKGGMHLSAQEKKGTMASPSSLTNRAYVYKG